MRRWFAIFLCSFSALCNAAPDSELWAFWDSADPSSTTVVDHSLWQSTLDNYLQPSSDGINRFNYQGAAENSSTLNTYIEQTTAIDPRQLNAREQMAYWINLYNAITVQVVLGYPGKDSILKMKRRFFSVGPWDDEVATIAGESITLNDIEHRILRPIWKDHRIHFAVNCASIGCPNLHEQAYTSSNLESLLNMSEQNYLNHERGATVLTDGSIQLSSIFKWYLSDFAESESGLLRYIATHNRALQDAAEASSPDVQYEYDWRLNSVSSR